MAKVLLTALLALLVCQAQAAPSPPATREQVEQLLSRELPSGSSPATVMKFLDGHGVEHGSPGQSGATVLLLGSFRNIARGTLQVRFSFLQDRLIGYSFTELPAGR
jgi:hypothetical protein